MNCSFSIVSKSIGSCMMTLRRAVLLGQRHDDVLAGDRLGHQLDDRGGDLDLAEVDELQAVLLGLGLHDVLGLGVAQLGQGVLERTSSSCAGLP